MRAQLRFAVLAAAVAVGASLPASAAEQVPDTARPQLPATRFGFQSDTLAFPVTHVDSTLIYYRTVVGMLFDSTATGPQVRAALQARGAEIIAGTNLGAFIVRIPDPGPDPEDLQGALRAIGAEPGVGLAYPKAYWRAWLLWSEAQADDLPVITIEGPAVIAFWEVPASDSALMADPGLAAALDDQQYYWAGTFDLLAELDIAALAQPGRSFRIQDGFNERVFAASPDSADIGYLFVAPGMDFHAVYRRWFPDEIVAEAKRYFAR